MAQHDYDIANASGAAVRADINNVLSAIVTMNSGATAPATTFAHQLWYDTSNDLIQKRNAANSAWITLFSFPVATDSIPYSRTVPLDIEEVQLALNDATPDVSGGIRFATNSAAPTTITNFVGTPAAGWRFLLRAADTNTTISGTLTKTGRAIPLLVDDYLEFEYDGAAWNQVGGTVGMGQYVPLAEYNEIGDWIAPSQVTYATVDVTDDGVRQGANAVFGKIYFDDPTAEVRAKIRRNGSVADANPEFAAAVSTTTGETSLSMFSVELDDSGLFEARYDVSVTYTSDEAYVIGYTI